jgi:dienelactone hydrolase
MHLYGGTVHGFTDSEVEKHNAPNAIRYSPEAAARSWTAL